LCLLIDQELQALGVFIPAIRPPTVPNHSARLRVTFSALHAQQDIQALIQVLMNLESKFLPT
jgi:8-amino-7-oxononanoate synthase